MKHISQIMPAAISSVGETSSEIAKNTDLRSLQVQREDAQAINDVAAMRALDDRIEDLTIGGVE